MRLLLLGAAMLSAGCAHNRQQASVPPPSDSGKARFETYCAGCHLDEGPFMIGQAPPLEGSSWLAAPEALLIRIVLHGLHGPIEVRGKLYNQEMPGFAPVLSDDAIASLLTHARARFAVVAPPFSPAAVARIRSENPNRTDYWTVAELLKSR